MKSLVFLLLVLPIAASFAAPAENPDALIKNATLLLEDDFNREEADDSKEQLGKKWETNSAKRAKGVKQGDLKDGALIITMAKVADHGVSIKHDAPFDDGVVRARIKMHDAKGIKFNFNDPEANKLTWAGHIAGVAITPNGVQIQDHIKGIFDLKIREKRLGGASKAEMAKLLEGREARFKSQLKLEQWYEVTLVFRGPVLTVYIDGKKVGELDSEGLDHPVKQNLAFAVSGVASVDEVRIWSLN